MFVTAICLFLLKYYYYYDMENEQLSNRGCN